ncbi:hypothetical protein J4727_18975, partial [Providencia rettgeri]|nr:hypothetical protein [Providencia rettgeri]
WCCYLLYVGLLHAVVNRQNRRFCGKDCDVCYVALYVAMAVTAPAITEVHIDHKHYRKRSFLISTLHYHYFNAGFAVGGAEDFSLR